MTHRSDGERAKAPLWAPCPPGEFERLSGRLRRRRHRRAFLKGAAVATAATLAGSGLWLWLTSGGGPEPSIAGLSCEEVHDLAAAYGRGELDEARREQVRQHVARCPRCGPLFKSRGMTL